MARSRSIHFYPPGYFEIVKTIGRDMGTSTIEVPSEREARSLQGRFYAFVGAMKVAARQLKPGPQATEMDRLVQELFPFAHKVQVLAESDLARDPSGAKRFLVFSHRAESWHAKAFEAAARGASYGQGRGPAAPATVVEPAGPSSPDDDAAAAASFERLQKLLAGDGPSTSRAEGYTGRPLRGAEIPGLEVKPAGPIESPQEGNQPPVIKE